MVKKFKLGVIGAGFMANAIIKGVISSGVLRPEDIFVSDINDNSLTNLSKQGVNVTLNNNDILLNCEYVLFAIKPQTFNAVFDNKVFDENYKLISIMAGVNIAKIKSIFPNSKVARCMPNTPCSVGAGAVGIDATDFTEKTDIDFIKNLFSSIAEVIFIAEDKLNAVTAISGSSPAYFYLFLKSVIEAGMKNGLSFKEARDLATSTMIGAGKMVKKNKSKSLDELIDAVCSKGGTTIEAINVFKQEGIEDITLKAVDACVKRASELENF